MMRPLSYVCPLSVLFLVLFQALVILHGMTTHNNFFNESDKNILMVIKRNS